MSVPEISIGHHAKSRRVVIDCRWLAFSGAGRVVELLLRGLRERTPRHNWVLWGPDAVEAYKWRGAELALTRRAPNAWRGQRDWMHVPRADLVVFMHQQRPLCRVPALTTILDTTPIQFPNGRLDECVKARFLKEAARLSRHILTISQFSKGCIESLLGVCPDKISVLELPADAALAKRVLDRRERSVRQSVALYLGLFLPHKNLPRLIDAFDRTSFCASGGQLLLVGGKRAAPDLEARLTAEQRRYVTVHPYSTQEEVEKLLATSLFLVQPSLVEGFGLSVWEAMACGLPVCVSDGGALPEVVRGMSEPFPATSVTAMSAAIDACAIKAKAMNLEEARALSRRLLMTAPTLDDFARQFEAVIDRQFSPSGG